jgi:hypothetical protein
VAVAEAAPVPPYEVVQFGVGLEGHAEVYAVGELEDFEGPLVGGGGKRVQCAHAHDADRLLEGF